MKINFSLRFFKSVKKAEIANRSIPLITNKKQKQTNKKTKTKTKTRKKQIERRERIEGHKFAAKSFLCYIQYNTTDVVCPFFRMIDRFKQ